MVASNAACRGLDYFQVKKQLFGGEFWIMIVLALWASFAFGFMALLRYSNELRADKYSELNCKYEWEHVRDVYRVGALHPCSVYIDRYRFLETEGLGFLQGMGVHDDCLQHSDNSSRTLNCSNIDNPKYVKSYPEKQ